MATSSSLLAFVRRKTLIRPWFVAVAVAAVEADGPRAGEGIGHRTGAYVGLNKADGCMAELGGGRDQA